MIRFEESIRLKWVKAGFVAESNTCFFRNWEAIIHKLHKSLYIYMVGKSCKIIIPNTINTILQLGVGGRGGNVYKLQPSQAAVDIWMHQNS